MRDLVEFLLARGCRCDCEKVFVVLITLTRESMIIMVYVLMGFPLFIVFNACLASVAHSSSHHFAS